MAKGTKAAVVSSLPVKVNLSEVSQGDIFSESSHYILKGKERTGELVFTHVESNTDVKLTPAYVQALLTPADQYTKVEKVTKEDSRDGKRLGIRTIWEGIHSDKVFTVCFKKQDTAKTATALKVEIESKVAQAVAEIEQTSKSKKGVAAKAKEVIEALVKNPISDVVEGEDRILRGYKLEFNSRDGKYMCLDMELMQPRPVNINTIQWLVVDGIKYEL